MSICAVVDKSTMTVINVIVAEPADLAPIGCELVEVGPDQRANIGWTWDGSQFIPLPDPEESQIGV